MSNANMDTVNEIGLAVVGCGTIGRNFVRTSSTCICWVGLRAPSMPSIRSVSWCIHPTKKSGWAAGTLVNTRMRALMSCCRRFRSSSTIPSANRCLMRSTPSCAMNWPMCRSMFSHWFGHQKATSASHNAQTTSSSCAG